MRKIITFVASFFALFLLFLTTGLFAAMQPNVGKADMVFCLLGAGMFVVGAFVLGIAVAAVHFVPDPGMQTGEVPHG